MENELESYKTPRSYFELELSKNCKQKLGDYEVANQRLLEELAEVNEENKKRGIFIEELLGHIDTLAGVDNRKRR